MKVSNNNNGQGLGICDRCACQYPYQMLTRDGNTPGMLVCPTCWDPIDPYRLPPKQDQDFIITNPRPPEPLTVPGTYYLAQNFHGATTIDSDGVIIDPPLYGPTPQ